MRFECVEEDPRRNGLRCAYNGRSGKSNTEEDLFARELSFENISEGGITPNEPPNSQSLSNLLYQRCRGH